MNSLPEKIGKYPVLGLAGTGNMATVFVGHDPFADRDVALKLCTLPDRGDDNSARVARKLFFNEAHTAGALDHPNILKVFDAGEERGQPYIVMEYVAGGRTLGRHCATDALLPCAKVAEYIAHCAAALDYAHRRGVVHRDIKPTNIMLTPTGEVKIGDFGIAQRASDESTQVSGMMGSPRYMSPEQVDDGELTGQTDIFSLGVVMYELLSGRSPYNATSLPSLFKQILYDEAPPLGELRADLIDGLERIVRRALEKELRKRYRTGAEFAIDLVALYRDTRAERRPDPSQQQRFEALRRLGFFNEFSDSELLEIVDSAQWNHLPATKPCGLCRRHNNYALLVSGDAEVVQSGKVRATLSSGEVFANSANSADCKLRARNGCVLVLLTDASLEQLSESARSRFHQSMLSALTARLSQSNARAPGSAT